MNYFAGDRFSLFTDSARALYKSCRDIPIFDYHNHLSPQLLYENKNFENLAQFWLTGDHYIWRAMRAAGVDERLITGDAPDYERYLAWVGTMEKLVGCQLYAWTQMQVARLFGEEEPLTLENAPAFYERGSALLQTDAFRPRSILRRFGVTKLCTTDEPSDSLEWHEKLRQEVTELTVLPAFRPDKLLNASKEIWMPALKKLEASEGMEIRTLDELKAALVHSLDRFKALGCCTSDHGYEGLRYGDPSGADASFASAFARGIATAEEEEHIASELLRFLGVEYHKRNMVMQLHIGALRNGNTRRYRALGADCGVDSVDDPIGVRALAPLMDELEQNNALPKTILYCLNEAEYSTLCTLAVSFAGGGVRDRVQVGSAWWFNDHERGMRLQLHQLMENALLPGFVGMLTDSRSLGTFVRHDYFRRILCDCVGEYVERGEFPLNKARQIVDDICYQNAITYFGG